MTIRETTVGEARKAGVAGLEGYPDDMKVMTNMPDDIAEEPAIEPAVDTALVDQPKPE